MVRRAGIGPPMSDDVVDQLKKVQVSKLTLGLVGSIIAVSAVVTWNAAQVASRIDTLERSVAAIEIIDTSDLVTSAQLLAAIQAIPEADLSDLSEDLEDLQDSVASLLLDADREPEWVDEIEEIRMRLVDWDEFGSKTEADDGDVKGSVAHSVYVRSHTLGCRWQVASIRSQGCNPANPGLSTPFQ